MSNPTTANRMTTAAHQKRPASAAKATATTNPATQLSAVANTPSPMSAVMTCAPSRKPTTNPNSGSSR